MLAVFGDECDAGTEGILHVAVFEETVGDVDLACVGGVGTEDDAGDFAASCTDESGHSDDFAGADLNVDVVENAGAGEVFHIEEEVAAGVLGFGFEDAFDLEQFTADHETDDFLLRSGGGFLGGNVFAVAEDRDSIGEEENFFHAVRDVEDADAFGFELADDAEEDFGFAGGEAGGGLVHDEEFAFLGECAGHADHLALGHGEFADGADGVNGFAEAGHEGAGFAEHSRAVEEDAGEAGFATDEDVVLGVEVGEGDGFLMDDGNSGGFRGADAAQRHLFAVDGDAAGVRPDAAGDDFDERGFAGPVFADEGVDFARFEFKGNVAEGTDAAEGFGDGGELEQGLIL